MKHNILAVAGNFQIQGRFITGDHYGSGHINDTYVVSYEHQGERVRYIFQRINHHIFKDVPALMENIARVTRQVRIKLEAAGENEIDRRTLTLIPTVDGQDFLHDVDGLYWRAYQFIESAKTYDIIENTKQAYEAAKAFGQFQCALADLPPPRLNETIINFHHTRSRFDALIRAIEADSHGRVAEAQAEIAFAREREAMVDVLLDLQAAGKLPERITHNDTKLNNVMIDDHSAEGICVIDLDTVMPGLALYDFGDMVRTATNTGAEDDQDLSRVSSDLSMFEALVEGYLASTRSVLVEAEIEHLTFSGRLMTFEVGLRFLTDYLSGDGYFKTHREGHNLDRCRVQFKLVADMESKREEMEAIVRSCLAGQPHLYRAEKGE